MIIGHKPLRDERYGDIVGTVEIDIKNCIYVNEGGPDKGPGDPRDRRVLGARCPVPGAGCRVLGAGCRVLGTGRRVPGAGGLCFEAPSPPRLKSR